VYTVFPWHVTGEKRDYTDKKKIKFSSFFFISVTEIIRKGKSGIKINRGFNSLQSPEKKK
jgi:hypothetical protein